MSRSGINCLTFLSAGVVTSVLCFLGYLGLVGQQTVSCSTSSLLTPTKVNDSLSSAELPSALSYSPTFTSCTKHTVLCHRQQRHYLDSSRTGSLSSMRLDALKYLLHGTLTSIEFQCPKKRGFGTPGLGLYEVCMVSNVTPKPHDCLIYSFGVSNDWSFDEAFGKYGCEVHSFDPSLGLKDHMHAPNVTFHNTGLWGSDIVNTKGWKLERLSTIRKKLGHEERVIDILKVDVEGGEWPFLRDVLYKDPSQLTTVKQILTELHSPRFKHETVTKRDYIEMILYINELRRMEFEIFKNYHDGNCCEVFAAMMPPEIPERCCEEIALINKRFL